jgi:hypothetical protein
MLRPAYNLYGIWEGLKMVDLDIETAANYVTTIEKKGRPTTRELC